jgi:hypothetical protein
MTGKLDIVADVMCQQAEQKQTKYAQRNTVLRNYIYLITTIPLSSFHLKYLQFIGPPQCDPCNSLTTHYSIVPHQELLRRDGKRNQQTIIWNSHKNNFKILVSSPLFVC